MKELLALFAAVWVLAGAGVVRAQEQTTKSDDVPLATFLVLSNPYITTLPKEKILDENGRDRGFLAGTVSPALKKALALTEEVKPDALIVLGSLTWSGSKADFAAFDEHFENVTTPTFFVPGVRDELGDGLEQWRKKHPGNYGGICANMIGETTLVFSDSLDSDPDDAVGGTEEILDLMEKDLSTRSAAVLLFNARPEGNGRSRKGHKAFWQLIENRKIAAEFESTRYGHGVRLNETLPTWRAGSTGWSTRGAVTRVRVFKNRIEIAEIRTAEHDGFVLEIPNPVAAPRLARVEDDPYRCLSYSAELAKKPDYTVALISDPQFDREVNRATLISRADAGIADLNILKPDLVFITGDLVNNNLPEEWELFREHFGKLEVPYKVVPGNHDVLFNYDFVEASYSEAPQKKPEYAEIVKKALAEAKAEGFTGPAALYEKYTGSPPRQLIEHGEDAFITVPFLTMRADQEQIGYLAEQLKKTEGKRHVFVAAHYPSLPVFGNNVLPDQGGREVLGLLRDHKVTAFVFGHRHRNGFARFENTAHVLTDNMGTIHLLHVHDDHIIVGRKVIGAALYQTLRIDSPR